MRMKRILIIVWKNFLRDDFDIFSYYVERDEECDKMLDKVEEAKEDIQEEPKTFSVVNCDKKEFHSIKVRFAIICA